MPHVIFFKKVNKRSIVNYENENFPKYLLDFKKKLTTDKNVRVSYRRKNNNMGKIGKIQARINELSGMMKQVLGKKKNKKSQKRVVNDAGLVGGIPIDSPEVNVLFQAFVEALQNEGYISKKPLNQRNVANNNAALAPDKAPASINGPVGAIYGLRMLKEKISANNFVAALPNASAVAADGINGQNVIAGTANNSWSVADVNSVKNEYKKLSDTINELKSLMTSLQI